MGIYLNPGPGRYQMAHNSAIFVDKSAMLRYLNSVVMTNQRYVCVSRPRRFGKTIAADMVCAYYGQGEGARELFEGLAISRTEPVDAWDAHLGAYDVIRVTMTQFVRRNVPIEKCLARMSKQLARDLQEEHPEVEYLDEDDIVSCMQDAFFETGRRFVVVIDEWDSPMRERASDETGQRAYLDFLRDWLKDQEFLALAYMTGILPIKKYGLHSALNMFDGYSMAAPLELAEYTGFTEGEVRALCEEWGRDFSAMRDWYDGYEVVGSVSKGDATSAGPTRYSLYSPLSVVKALRTGIIESYWSHTETYRALADYIRMDFDGLKRAVSLMMDGGRVAANLRTYQNDMTTFHSRDDVIALLVHLGYLGWDSQAGEAFIPNREVREIFADSTQGPEWDQTFCELEESKALVQAIWDGNATRVAELLEAAHDRADNKGYNSEAALSYAVQLGYYAAHKWYTKVVELDSGKGFADVAYLPSPKHPDLPAMVVELKQGKEPQVAIDQIRSRDYADRLGHYAGNTLLVGISYDATVTAGDADFKRHRCVIERA